MTNEQIINQLLELIDDRKSLMDNDPEHDEIYIKDINALKAAIEFLKNEPVNGWISVKDRLPDKDGDYLCYLECGEVCQSAFDSTIASDGEEFPFGEWISVYDSGTLGFVDSHWEEHDAITHWRSLPEPPKEEVET